MIEIYEHPWFCARVDDFYFYLMYTQKAVKYQQL